MQQAKVRIDINVSFHFRQFLFLISLLLNSIQDRSSIESEIQYDETFHHYNEQYIYSIHRDYALTI